MKDQNSELKIIKSEKADDTFNILSGKIKMNFKEKCISDIFTVSSTGLDKVIKENEKLVKMVNYMDVYKNKLNLKNLLYTSGSMEKIIQNKLKVGDILITPTSETPNDIFNTAVFNVKTDDFIVYSYHLTLLRPCVELNSIYYKYYFDTSNFRNMVSKLATGSTRFTLSKKEIEKLIVKELDIVQQNKIANLLSSIDQLIEYKKALIKELELNFIYNVNLNINEFGSKNFLFSDLFENYSGTALESEVCVNGKYKFISIGNYTIAGKYKDDNKRINKNKKTTSRILNKDDIVMVLNDKSPGGDIIGSSILIDEDDCYIFNQRSERLVCKENINPKFAWFLLNSNYIRQTIRSMMQGGTQYYFNYSSLGKKNISIPTLNKQVKIANLLSSMDK